MGKKILIIKLASCGDVLRTTVILSALRRKYPSSFITWLVKEPAQELLEGNPYIDRILVYNSESIPVLEAEKFDLVISLDKAREAIALASLIEAKEKCGYGLSQEGNLYPFNKAAEYSYRLGLDDDLKFRRNKKTYQEMIFEIANLDYKRQEYELRLSAKELDFADTFFKENNLVSDDFIIGINTGAGKVFANKNLQPKRIVELIEVLNAQLQARILLLGGPAERAINNYILEKVDCKIVSSGCMHSIKEFAALINKCSLVIAADTLALHIAIAMKRPVIALFGPTCAQEIDLYNRGCKIITTVECAPCYKNKCDEQITCMDKVDLNRIVETVKDISQVVVKA